MSILYLQNVSDGRLKENQNATIRIAEHNDQNLSIILQYTTCVTSPQFKEYCKTNNGFPLLTF